VHAVDVEDLQRTYASGAQAVRGISFTVAPGEVFALLGTNGAGKTSTVEVVAGLAAATAGRVRVLGHDPRLERRAVRPRTGVVLQSGGLPGELTVDEAVRMWAGTLSRHRPAGELLETVGLLDRRRTPLAVLSGGERRRLDLALALLGQPELLLLDEPTTGLDVESRRRVWDLVRRLVAEGTAVLLTTHHLEEAEELADRLALMHAGRIAVEGTLSEIVASHRAEIRWAATAGRPPEGTLTSQEDVRVEARHVVVRTPHLQRSLSDVVRWADRDDVVLPELRATPATLEAAFLDLTRATDDIGIAAAPRTLEVAR
jgi:ABC-2 type transport system ATP-binding protein